MSGLLVVDSSVVFKWFRQKGDEPRVDEAVGLLEHHLQGGIQIHAPDLLVYEVGNILRFKGHLTKSSPAAIIKDLFNLRLIIHPIGPRLAAETLDLTMEYRATYYDSAFLALARILDCPFVTADEALTRQAKGFKGLKLL